MHRHPDCSERRRRLAARSPHGHEQHARTTDATGREPRVPRSYGRYLVALYNEERQHQSLGYRTPQQIYQEGLWIYGRSALPTGCASPLPEPARKAGKCSPSPTSPQAPPPTRNLILMEVNSRLVKPAVASTAIGADIETGRATP